jgi:hypothetical protein
MSCKGQLVLAGKEHILVLRNKLWICCSAVVAAQSFSLFDYSMFVNVFWCCYLFLGFIKVI